MTDTKGYIYFGIKTENWTLNEVDLEQHLGIKSAKFEILFSRELTPRCIVRAYFTGILINPIYYKEIEDLISKLLPHKQNLKKFKESYPQVNYYLEVVIFLGDEIPRLCFSLEVLSFLNEIGAQIDCDIYNSKLA